METITGRGGVNVGELNADESEERLVDISGLDVEVGELDVDETDDMAVGVELEVEGVDGVRLDVEAAEGVDGKFMGPFVEYLY